MSTRKTARRADDEQGFVLVFVAIVLILLLGLAGLMVDFTNWSWQRTKIQRAADAAALAGAIYLPSDPATAIQVALDTAASNGYPSGVTVVPGSGTTDDRLTVTINASIQNYFAGVMGFNTTTLSKAAVAVYDRPVAQAAPLDLVLIIDRTGSMSGPDLTNAKSASMDLLAYLTPSLHHVALGVLGASDSANACANGAFGNLAANQASPTATWIASPFPYGPLAGDYLNANGTINSNSQLVKTIQCLDTSGRTNLGTPIDAAHTYLDTYARPGVKRAIILFTDGAANLPNDQSCKYAVDAANAAKAGIDIVTIGFGVETERCLRYEAVASPYYNSPVTKVLADMASPINGVPADDNGCTDLENTDGDNFFCQPKSADLSGVFVQAVSQLTGPRSPRLVK